MQAHDLAFFGPGGDFEAIRQGLAFDDERVIAGGLERTRHAGEDALAGMMDRRGLAVHQAVGADDIAAVDLADGLVAEADAEDRRGGAELA